MNANITRFDTQALNRALVGFDRLFDTFEHRIANQMQNNYPPHNIIKLDDTRYVIEVAVAGFRKDEIHIEVEQNLLTIRGVRTREDGENIQYLHRGLSSRDFERKLQLAEHMLVKGALIQDGILSVQLEHEIPEEKKARVIDIVEVK
jgi:molecular chaperone IbpA